MSIPQFILFKTEDKEILVNVNTIWKIEVTFPQRDPKTGRDFATSVDYGSEHPDGSRVYKIFYGNEPLRIPAKVGDPVSQVLWDIYKNAIRYGVERRDDGGESQDK